MAESTDPMQRSRLLPAAVEILVAVGDLAGAGQADTELAAIADDYGTTALAAMSGQASGTVRLAEETPSMR
jgi:hypothetical protein